jgi:hypothetical protein
VAFNRPLSSASGFDLPLDGRSLPLQACTRSRWWTATRRSRRMRRWCALCRCCPARAVRSSPQPHLRRDRAHPFCGMHVAAPGCHIGPQRHWRVRCARSCACQAGASTDMRSQTHMPAQVGKRTRSIDGGCVQAPLCCSGPTRTRWSACSCRRASAARSPQPPSPSHGWSAPTRQPSAATVHVAAAHMPSATPVAPNPPRTTLQWRTPQGVGRAPFLSLFVHLLAVRVPFLAVFVPFLAVFIPFLTLSVPFLAVFIPFLTLSVPLLAVFVPYLIRTPSLYPAGGQGRGRVVRPRARHSARLQAADPAAPRRLARSRKCEL